MRGVSNNDTFFSISFSAVVLITLILSGVHFTSATDAKTTRQEDIPSSEFSFFNYTLYQESSLVYRSAVGDLLPERDGVEMATCSVDGVVSVHYGEGLSWKTESVHRSFFGGNSEEKAKVYSLDVGDILPERDGDEIVAVGENRGVFLIYWGGSNWISELIWEDMDWLYEVDIGNIYDDPEQPEIVIVGENRTVTVLGRSDTGWTGEVIYIDNYYLDTCFISDIYPDSDGNEITTAGGSGSITVLYREDGTWISTNIYSFGSADGVTTSVLDIIVIDMDPRYKGPEVVAATFDKKVMSVYRSGDSWDAQIIHNEGNLVYCLEYGSLINDSLTIAVASWNGRTGVIYFDGTYNFREVYREQYEIYGCLIADIDPTHIGNELISLSRLGRITMNYRDEPGADIEMAFNATSVHPGESIDIPFIVRYKGGYQGYTDISSSDGSLSVNRLTGTSISVLSYTAPDITGILNIEIRTVSEEYSDMSTLKINVDENSIPVSLGPSVINTEVDADRQVEEIFFGFSNDTLNQAMEISTLNVPKGLSATLPRSLCEPCETRDYLSMIISAASWIKPDIYKFFILGTSERAMQRAIAISINISERNLADLILSLDDDDLILNINDTVQVDLKLISINGFTARTDIIFDYVPPEISVNISVDSVIPTDNVTLSITGLSVGGPFIIIVQGRAGNLSRYARIRVEILPPPSDLVIELQKGDLIYNRTSQGDLEIEFTISLSPTYGVIENVNITPKTTSEEYTLELDRGEFKRIPYALDEKVRIIGSRESVPDQLIFEITFDGPGSPKELTVDLNIPDENGSDGNAPNIAVFLIPLIIMGIILSAGIYLYMSGRRSNHLNQNDDHQDSDGGKPVNKGKDHSNSHSYQAGEPIHKRPSGAGRMDNKHR